MTAWPVRVIVARVETAADLDRYPSDECDLCDGTGTMAWQQPSPDGVLRAMEVPCPNGCGGHWKHPAAERDRVINEPDERPMRTPGRADEANAIGGDFIGKFLDEWQRRR